MENKVKRKNSGFSLIELMIVVAIIGIIAMIAYPAYRDYMTEARRAQGQSVLLDAQLKEERYRSYNNNYGEAASLAAAGIGFGTDDYYNFDVVSVGTNTYRVRATATGTQLANDGACSPLSIDQNNNKLPAGCWQD
ncbi:type IV pilin protein [Neptuniibacter sp.]|uniref:type IV pilin protein n=1 Tax=Neptuniibacter sp. TaxID=1962643 RepID=UPI003B5BC200